MATSMAAPLTKKAVRTTFVSGRLATMRRLGCQAGTTTTAALLFLVSVSAILRVVVDHQAQQPEPAEFPGRLGECVRDDDLARPEPRDRVELQRRDAERGGKRALEPRELRRKLDADHLADGLAGLDLVEADRGLELLQEALYQQRAHSREIERV